VLFNSYVFILVFLPTTLAVFYAIGGSNSAWIRGWLTLTSLYFYGFWNISFLPLLVGSIGFNYFAGRIIEHLKSTRSPWRGPAFVIAVGSNLALLSYFKYATFLQNIIEQLAGLPGAAPAAPIPLGISFFTFTQITYLADVTFRDRAQRDPISYALFVSFFPHLIAGPILHHRQTIPQFSFQFIWQNALQNLAIGLSMFSFGLFKKVVLADSVQPFVSLGFSNHNVPNLLDAWTGVLAYTMQIYFDFSGYTDMAIGLARMFGVIFPINFNSPYQATNVIEFWRRWHMTLSRFLRDYVYIPIGGNRSGLGQYPNILITMLLGGLWHGAGWTFIAWGGLHGLFLVINHAWQRARSGSHTFARGREWLSRCVTFLAVALAWVFFRADGMEQAFTVLSAAVGAHGIGKVALMCIDPNSGSCALGIPVAWYWIAGLLCIAFFAPNTQQVMNAWKPVLEDVRVTGMQARWRFMPTLPWAIGTGLLFAIAFAMLNEHSQFLYYQF